MAERLEWGMWRGSSQWGIEKNLTKSEMKVGKASPIEKKVSKRGHKEKMQTITDETKLITFHSLGQKIVNTLRTAGVVTRGDLKQYGVVKAYKLIIGQTDKRNYKLLWALEAAVSGNKPENVSDTAKMRIMAELLKS